MHASSCTRAYTRAARGTFDPRVVVYIHTVSHYVTRTLTVVRYIYTAAGRSGIMGRSSLTLRARQNQLGEWTVQQIAVVMNCNNKRANWVAFLAVSQILYRVFFPRSENGASSAGNSSHTHTYTHIHRHIWRDPIKLILKVQNK